MSRPSLATPCPAPHPRFGVRRLSTASLGCAQDDTADLEYTRAITQELQNAKPKRQATYQRRERKNAPITIFEDVAEDQELVIAESRREIGGGMLLGKAARKMPRSSMARQQETIEEEQPAQAKAHSKRRVSTLADSIPGLRFKMAEPAKEAPQDAKPQGGLKKDPRRRTIFVPSDDTTMLTIHPGANTTDRLNDTFQLPSLVQRPPPEHETTLPQSRPSPKPAVRRARMSLAVAPKRLPLQHMATEKGNIQAADVPGRNGGKENLPPRSQISAGEKKPSSRLYAPTAASQARGSIQSRRAAPAPGNLQRSRATDVANAGTSRPSTTDMRESHIAPPSQLQGSQQRHQAPGRTQKTSLASTTSTGMRQTSTTFSAVQRSHLKETSHGLKRSSPTQRPSAGQAKASKLQQYPVLCGDLAQPDLYEDDWLRHQEIALTELINQLFSGAQRKEDEWHDPGMSLQERLVELYHQPHVSTLHQRLQASIRYGALSMPKDASPIVLSQDIGLRRRFLNLWLDSYDEELLRDAAQVIVGRQITQSRASDGQTSMEGNMDPHHGRRKLIGFLETFFVSAHDSSADVDAEEGRWRKTVARSLMLIWLLDQAKTSHAISRCLFKASSPRKTSTHMLHTLATIALPSSIGDITRVLRQCDYGVCHQQDPLDEVTYRIDNMASDMRDGIFLTRLIEMLLFSSTPNTLSQHLKMPCLGRAQKLFNVQIALSALNDRGRLGDAVHQITAEAIVDGHREKTLSLLWALVSAYGLESLIDFQELRKDIRKYANDADILQHSEYLSQHEEESLLQTWAAALCAKEDIEVTNLTTSFVDGRAYAAIVEAFASFCGIADSPTGYNKAHDTFGAHALSRPHKACAARLRALGCSSAFIASLTSTNYTISNRQTTISNLAFLASRLLPLKRRHNAALTIQHAFRLRRSRIAASQRVALMRLAHACSTVVQTQNRLVFAATVLQRAWRGVLEARIGRLNHDVEEFQVLARGWTARRRAMASRRGAPDRVMGGW